MVAEFSETDEVLEADPIRGAILPLIEAIFVATHDGSRERAAAFVATHDGSRERAAAMGELMLAVGRIRAALRSQPRLN
jgi:hypothetical protein